MWLRSGERANCSSTVFSVAAAKDKFEKQFTFVNTTGNMNSTIQLCVSMNQKLARIDSQSDFDQVAALALINA